MSEPLTDKDIMPFGGYKGKAMADVPAGYLNWLKNQYEINGCRGEDNERVRQYINENWDAIELELRKGGKQ